MPDTIAKHLPFTAEEQRVRDAAPDLLAALKECVGYVDAVAATLSTTNESIPAATAKAAHAAIKKATDDE